MFRRFLGDDRGYALVLTLIFLPVFVGIGLLVLDVGRGNNAQSDLQAAADTLALAGARELDGNADSITRALDAMEEVTNSASFLGLAGSAPIRLDYTAGSTSPFRIRFLKAIPASDDLPINAAWVATNETSSGIEAKYVYVFVRSTDLTSFFFNPVTRARETVGVGATAVATLRTATCDLAPFFMCNPFATYAALDSAYQSGNLYGRLMRLSVHTGNSTAGPGNIGFLRIDGNGAVPTAEALAGKRYNQCLSLTARVNTQPGTITPAWEGFNTRFDMYSNNFGGIISRTGNYPPAENVRKGYRANGNQCNLRSPTQEMGNPPSNDDLARYFGINPATGATTPALLADAAPFMSDNAGPGLSPIPAFIQRGSWNLFAPVTVQVSPTETRTFPPYWQTAYNDTLTVDELKALSRHPQRTNAGLATHADITALETSSGIPFVSRYDVYMHEIELQRSNTLPPYRAGGEDNLPGCFSRPTPLGIPIDRRTMFVAIIDCAAANIAGAEREVPVQGYAKMFLVRPVDENGPTKTLDMELVDLSSVQGLGETDEFLKTEALLVR